MVKKGVQIDGLNDLLKQLDKLGDKADAHRKEILHKAGLEMQEEVKQNARKLDDSLWTEHNESYGTLEQNIWMEWDEKEKTTYISTGNAFWSQFLEYGSDGVTSSSKSRKGKKKPRKNKGQSPQPFMLTSYLNKEKRMREIIEQELKKVLKL